MIKGIDLSHWETVESWSTLSKQDVQFGYTKISEGKTFPDPARKEIIGGFNSIKMPAGGYHVIHCDQDIAAQVAWFKKCISGLSLQCRHMIDFETEVNASVPKSQRKKACLEMVRAFKKEFGQKPILYFNSSDEKEFAFTEAEQSEFDTWLANYDAKTLPVPKYIKRVFIWQHSDKQNVPGVGPCDHNYCYGTLDELKGTAQVPQIKPEEPKETLSVRKANFLKVADSLGYSKQGQDLLDFWAKAYPNANPRYYALFDVGMPDTRRRFFVVDSDHASVQPVSAAHGKGSDMNDDDIADKFSNTPDSKMTSLGIYRCAEEFKGSHAGLSLKLDGLQSTNSQARNRAIIIHQASYVKDGGLVGRSWGCPSLDPKVSDEVIKKLEGGSPLYIFKA